MHFRYHRLTCGDWWDEDPGSPTYNEFRHVACGTRPAFGGGSEALWRATVAYRLFAVLEYNTARIPGRGSAMFLHVDNGPRDERLRLASARAARPRPPVAAAGRDDLDPHRTA